MIFWTQSSVLDWQPPTDFCLRKNPSPECFRFWKTLKKTPNFPDFEKPPKKPLNFSDLKNPRKNPRIFFSRQKPPNFPKKKPKKKGLFWTLPKTWSLINLGTSEQFRTKNIFLIFSRAREKIFFSELKKKSGYSFDGENSALSIYDVFRMFWARQLCQTRRTKKIYRFQRIS